MLQRNFDAPAYPVQEEASPPVAEGWQPTFDLREMARILRRRVRLPVLRKGLANRRARRPPEEQNERIALGPLRLIHDLLQFARVGTRGKEFRPVPAARIVADALANLMSEAFGNAPTYMENDGNLAALAEYHMGAARGADDSRSHRPRGGGRCLVHHRLGFGRVVTEAVASGSRSISAAGLFGARTRVSLTNDCPVTILREAT